jgi:DNA-binding GntR family transcriptional regulator
MENRKNQGNKSLDEFIRDIRNQELKGILLKLKNEIRKPDVPWVDIKTILKSLYNKDKDAFYEILSLIIH